MDKIALNVSGMTCGGCVKSIQNALNGRDGVENATANLEAGTVAIEFNPAVIQQSALEKAIADAGFDVV